MFFKGTYFSPLYSIYIIKTLSLENIMGLYKFTTYKEGQEE